MDVRDCQPGEGVVVDGRVVYALADGPIAIFVPSR